MNELAMTINLTYQTEDVAMSDHDSRPGFTVCMALVQRATSPKNREEGSITFEVELEELIPEGVPRITIRSLEHLDDQVGPLVRAAAARGPVEQDQRLALLVFNFDAAVTTTPKN